MSVISQNLKRLRLGLGLTQAELSVVAGIPAATIRNWERGRHDPQSGALATLAEALQCSVGDLVTPSSEPVVTQGVGRPRVPRQEPSGRGRGRPKKILEN